MKTDMGSRVMKIPWHVKAYIYIILLSQGFSTNYAKF